MTHIVSQNRTVTQGTPLTFEAIIRSAGARVGDAVQRGASDDEVVLATAADNRPIGFIEIRDAQSVHSDIPINSVVQVVHGSVVMSVNIANSGAGATAIAVGTQLGISPQTPGKLGTGTGAGTRIAATAYTGIGIVATGRIAVRCVL